MATERTYPIPLYGYGPAFTEAERPPLYASQLVNRFINPGGGAEVRRGLTQVGATITNVSAPELKSLHEIVQQNGTAAFLVAGEAVSHTRIWRLDTSAETTWTQVYGSGSPDGEYRSAQFDEKMIFVNSEDRNLYTTNPTSALAFKELFPIIVQTEQESTASAQDRHKATDVFGSTKALTDWLAGTNVGINDLLWDASTSAGAMITEVLTSSLSHQPLSAASPGFMSGNATKAGGDRIEIRDLVELNVIPVASQDPDNVAVGGHGTSAAKIQVSSNNARVNFAQTEVREGDFINNVTRNRMAKVLAVSGFEVRHTSITGQTSGDSFTFHKYAMPIAERAHVHYGRTYYLDARDETKIRVAGVGDPQDLTTDAGTLDASTFHAGGQSPVGDQIKTMGTFNQFFYLAGSRTLMMFTGTDPIQDTTADARSFSPVASYPVGVIGGNCAITIGNDLVFLSREGLFAAALRGNETTPTREILSDSLREEIQAEVSGLDDDDVKLTYYPKRSWLLVKASAGRLYNYSFAPNLNAQARQEGDATPAQGKGSWNIFEGRFARMNDYFVRNNSRLYCCDSSGRVFRFDDDGVYTDGSASHEYRHLYQSPWHGFSEQKGAVTRPNQNTKKGVYLKPNIQTSVASTYTFAASAPYFGSNGAGETVTQVVCGDSTPVHSPKIPLTWRGEAARFTISATAKGHDVLSYYSIGYNQFGLR